MGARCLIKTCALPAEADAFFCLPHGRMLPERLCHAIWDGIREANEIVSGPTQEWTPEQRAQLASGAYIVEMEHGVSRIRACAEFPPEKAEPWVTPKIGTSKGATLSRREARKLGLIP